MGRLYTGHEDMPALSCRPARLTAACYNCARLLRLRTEDPEDEAVWVDIPGLGALKLVVMPDAIVVIDTKLGDHPVAAWSGIAADPNRALHDAVPCEVKLYLAKAERMFDSLEDLVNRALETGLRETRPGTGGLGAVVPLPDRGVEEGDKK